MNALNKETLPTPSLLLDLESFESNVRAMSDFCRQSHCHFRPHAKTHKCPEIARRQVKAGAVGVCVATVPELESMVKSGIPGVLLTSPVVERHKIERIVRHVRHGADILLAVGDLRQIELLSQAAEAAGVELQLLVDLDVMDHRTGALPGSPALEVARKIDQQPRLRLCGIQAYAGGASHVVGFDQRLKISRQAMAKAVATRDLFAKSGLDTSIFSGGSTGTYNIDVHQDGVSELQVGSYIFMDADYLRIGSKSGSTVYSDFQCSLTILTTVVSAAHADRVTVDAGVKAMAESPQPVIKDAPDLRYERFGDEFGALVSESGQALPGLGDRLELVVPHCDPTVNLYDHICVMQGDAVQELWKVERARLAC